MAKILEIDTPESVPIRLHVSHIGSRTLAFTIDITIISMLIIAIIICAALLVPTLEGWGVAIILVFWFLLRNFYFFIGEVVGNGQTIGKKFARIRVVDHSGQPLTTNALFLRNVTRDLELFLPVTAVFYPEYIITAAPAWLGLIALGWVFAIAVIPFFHNQNARVGDLLAGTVVVDVPRPVLGEDLISRATMNRFVFNNEQLDMYGIFELQTLERVLRGSYDNHHLGKIAEKIANKTGFQSQNWQSNTREFLEEFYASLRARLETRMMLGDRQDRKKDGALETKSQELFRAPYERSPEPVSSATESSSQTSPVVEEDLSPDEGPNPWDL